MSFTRVCISIIVLPVYTCMVSSIICMVTINMPMGSYPDNNISRISVCHTQNPIRASFALHPVVSEDIIRKFLELLSRFTENELMWNGWGLSIDWLMIDNWLIDWLTDWLIDWWLVDDWWLMIVWWLIERFSKW